MPEREGRKRKWPYWALALAIILGAGFAYLSLVTFDLTGRRDAIRTRLEDITGAAVKAADLRLKVLPVPSIVATKVIVIEEDTPVISTEKMSFRVSILPLFLKKIVVSGLELEGMKVLVEREEDGKVKILNLIERIRGRKKRVTVVSMDAAGEVTFVDRQAVPEVRHLVTLERASLRPSGRGLHYRLSAVLNGETKVYLSGEVNKKTPGTRGEAVIEDLDLEALAPYIKSDRFGAKGSLSADLSYNYRGEFTARGPVNYKRLVLNLAGAYENPVPSDTGSLSLELILSRGQIRAAFKKMRLRTGGFVIKGSAEVRGPYRDPERTTIRLDIKSTSIPLEGIKAYIPQRLFHGKAARTIKGFGAIGGHVKVDGFTFISTAAEIRRKGAFKRPGAIDLVATLEEADFKWPTLKENLTSMKGRIIYRGDSLAFENLHGSYGQSTIRDFDWKIRNLWDIADYKLSLSGLLRADDTRWLIWRFHKRGKGVLSRKSLEKTGIRGLTDVAIRIKGDLHGKSRAVWSGTLKIKDVKLSHPDLPLAFTSVNGRVEFSNRLLTIRALDALDSLGSTFQIRGTVKDFSHGRPSMDLTLRGRARAGTVEVLTSGSPVEGLTLGGSFGYTVKAKGERDSLHFFPIVDARDASIGYRGLLKKPRGLAMGISGSVRLGPVSVDVEKMGLRLGASSIKVSGFFRRKSRSYTLYFNSKRIGFYDVDGIIPFLVDTPDASGKMTVALKISKSARRPAAYEGLVTLKDGAFKSAYTPAPFRDVDITANFSGDFIKVSVDELRAGKSNLKGIFNITSISKKTFTFDLNSDAFYVDDFKGRGGKILQKRHTAPGFTGRGRFRALVAEARGQELRGLDVRVALDARALRADPFTFVTGDGTVSGKGAYYLRADFPLFFDLRVNLSGLKVEKVLSGLGLKKKVLTGDLYGDVTLFCERWTGLTGRCLNGEISIRSERGRMWKFLFLSNIFSIVNIISIDELFKKGLPYREISVTFNVKKGVFSTDSLIFDSDSMRMSAVGQLDIAEKTVDGVLAIHPFVTMDKIITSIPIAGWIIGGKEKSAVSIYYRIKGPVKSPEISPAPVKNISEGVFKKLQRLIESPLMVIEEIGKGMGDEKDKKEKKE